MFKEQRQNEILRIIKQNKSINAKEMVKKFKVSDLTIRRDLNKLSEDNLIQRTHGGAIEKNDNLVQEVSFYERDTFNVAEKEELVKIVIKYIAPKDIVFIDGGTTNIRIARELKNKLGINIITNALKIAMELVNGNEVILLGGLVRGNSFNTVGELTLMQLDNIFADKYIMGIDGIDLKYGLTTTVLSESLVKSKMINRSKEVIVVADSSKIGKVGSFKVCALNRVNMIITDNKISLKQKRKIELLGVKVVTC